MAPLAPDTILQERYRIVQLIGQGGMGAVYEAFDQRLKSRVALKQMLVAGAALSRQFEREAQLLANLRHPALPRVIDHFSESNGQFLVMEYIPGEDLGTLLRSRGGPFPVATVLHWADQLLGALHYLHTRQPPVIHRDIKPQNLKLHGQDEIVLLDFGLAKGSLAGMTGVAGGQSIMGHTPGYAPPEQVEGLGTDARSDLYALGATLYYLLTNTPPPDAVTRMGRVVRRAPDPLRPAHEVNTAVPASISAVLQQSMALDSPNRFGSATAMRNALQTAARGAPSPVPVSVAAPTVIESPVTARESVRHAPHPGPAPSTAPQAPKPVADDTPRSLPEAAPRPRGGCCALRGCCALILVSLVLLILSPLPFGGYGSVLAQVRDWRGGPTAPAQAGTSTVPRVTTAESPASVWVVKRTGGRGVRLRATPSTTAAVVATLPEGTQVEDLGGEVDDGTRSWKNVRTPEGEGWVTAEFLDPVR